MLVNISDAIAMNAIPKYALLTVAIPKYYNLKDLDELASGFKKVAKKYKVQIIGGDTICNEKLDISVTIISKSKHPVLRTGTKEGNLVCYTGELGSCKKDLDKLLKGKTLSKNSKFIQPKLNATFFYEVSKYINSALDISDGLFFECERLSKANNVSFEFFEEIPTEIGCSGEEYELLFTFDEQHRSKIEKIAQEHDVKLNIFAKTIEGLYECKCKGHHF